MRHRWTTEEKEYLIQHQEMNRSELTERFNHEFNLELTYNQIIKCLNSLGITTNYRRYFSQEERDFLIENQASYSSLSELTAAFNRVFGTDCDYNQICHQLNRVGIHREPNAHAAHAAVTHPVGYCRKGSRGERMIKVADGRWVREYIAVWESHHGIVPADHIVIHLDNDLANSSIDNLRCIPRKYLAIMCQNHWLSSNPQITLTGIAWCDMYFQAKEVRNELHKAEV